MKNIKIVTINTWKCDGDYHTRMGLMAGALKALEADIVACQECFQSDNADTLKFLADSLNMYYSFIPGRFKKRFFENSWTDSYSGLGILSTFPITAVFQHELPAVEGDDGRKIQQAELALQGGKNLLLTNVHLTHLSYAVTSRKKQASAVAAAALTGVNYDYSLVCGDFNATISSEEINTFIESSGAVDCYSAGNGSEPRYSLAGAFEANRRICVDHLFTLPLSGVNAYPQFVNSAIALNTADRVTGLYPSDHFGISTELVTG